MDNYKLVKRIIEEGVLREEIKSKPILLSGYKIRDIKNLEEKIKSIIREEVTKKYYPYLLLNTYHRLATIRALYLTLLQLWKDYLEIRKELDEKYMERVSKLIIENFFYKLNLLFLKQNTHYKKLLDISIKNIRELINESSNNITKTLLLLL